jgi:hypothetical protein
MLATFPAHLTLPDLILIIFGAVQITKPPRVQFSQASTYFFLHKSEHFSSLCSVTPSPCCSLRVRNQIVHLYPTGGKVQFRMPNNL